MDVLVSNPLFISPIVTEGDVIEDCQHVVTETCCLADHCFPHTGVRKPNETIALRASEV